MINVIKEKTLLKTAATLAVIGACMAMGVSRASAAILTTNTNQVVTVTFSLTANVQSGDTITNATINNKEILSALRSALGTNFPSSASLVSKGRLGSDSASFYVFWTVDKTNDVYLPIPLAESPVQVVTGASGKDSIVLFDLSTPTLGFGVQGYITSTLSTKTIIHIGPQKVVAKIASSSVNGPGIVGGADAVIHGSVNGVFLKLVTEAIVP